MVYWPANCVSRSAVNPAGVNVPVTAAAEFSAWMMHTREWASVRVSDWVTVVLAMAALAPVPSEPRHTHTAPPNTSDDELVNVTVPDPPDAGVQDQDMAEALTDVPTLVPSAVNVPPLNVGVFSVVPALALAARATITSPGCQVMEEVALEDADAAQSVSAYSTSVGG